MLHEVRKTSLVDDLVKEGVLEEVRIEGSSRPYLAPAGFRDRRFGRQDNRMRILAPLDPLIWDRKLTKHIFDFDYVWEVYKPASQRKWGWYVCPLLHRGKPVGRLEGSVEGHTLVIKKIYKELPTLDEDALDTALQKHATACQATAYHRPTRIHRNPV